jgi:hypothetical protein
MDFKTTYCPTRRTLEQRSWDLTSILSAVAGRLLGTAGVDHAAFNAATADCREVRERLTESHRQVRRIDWSTAADQGS